ncbi:Uncharacterized protein A9P81_3223 [Leptospira interrogans serovar Copenhageni/Icterohaemorrhagiae]|nr:conserved hypothetical protein [Leptospira interrogans serovar Copenhageni str. Fiocruz L1-130]APH42764.1 Uncharacterized protein A9P81_3223 [Leptospira interrogans serovar Copenhageni/Icterohaemorrhagiae]KLO77839.1 Uncharacterized protein AAY48_0943 [Leptospira interrogans serovar Muenchen]KPA27936.1 Uncharacterized protein AMR48_1710 [Leptospira interrogans]QIP65313.1 hypothetical protein LICSK_15285 [Leptospira interrogans serovar Copenhageni]
MKLKSKYRIMFLLCNLLTRAESPVRLPMASRIRPSFLMSNLRIFLDRFLGFGIFYKFFSVLGMILICYSAIIYSQFYDQNSSLVTNQSSETEKEKTIEFKSEDFVSQKEQFAIGYDLEIAHYGDLTELILVQYVSKIENPPPEKLFFSI